MERLFSPLSEDQMTFPPNMPSYVPPGLSHGFAYGMSPFPGLYGQFPALYQAPPTAYAAVQQDASSELPRRRYRRTRYQYSHNQLAILGAMYEINKYPDAEQRAELVLKVGVDETRVQMWFKNRRRKERNMEKLEKRDQRLSREMRFKYRQPEPKPTLFAYGMNSTPLPVKRECPEPTCTHTHAGREETDTTYTELTTTLPDQSLSNGPFLFDPSIYPSLMADASSSTIGTTFQTQPKFDQLLSS